MAERSKGYVYLLSRTGITSTDRAAEIPQLAEVEALRKAHAAPLLLDFGISGPEHVKAALQSGADGAIAGSAVTKIIAENLGDHAKMLASLRAFVNEMKAAPVFPEKFKQNRRKEAPSRHGMRLLRRK